MPVTGLKSRYARVSTDEQDLTAQRDPPALGVVPDRTYVDYGLSKPTGYSLHRHSRISAPQELHVGVVLPEAQLSVGL